MDACDLQLTHEECFERMIRSDENRLLLQTDPNSKNIACWKPSTGTRLIDVEGLGSEVDE